MHDDKQGRSGGADRSILLLAAAAFVSGANLRVADPLIPTVADQFPDEAGGAAARCTA
jgi:hypothetical protein